MWGLDALINNPMVGRDIDLSLFYSEEDLDDGIYKIDDPQKTYWVDVDELDYEVYHPEYDEFCSPDPMEDEVDVSWDVNWEELTRREFATFSEQHYPEGDSDYHEVSPERINYDEHDVCDRHRTGMRADAIRRYGYNAKKEFVGIGKAIPNPHGLPCSYRWKDRLNWAAHGTQKPKYKNHRHSAIKDYYRECKNS